MKLQNEQTLITQAIAGDKDALARILTGVQDLVFTLSLRMLGVIDDAEDATQEILIKVMTHLSSFRGESSLATWVFRIATNHLQSYRKGMFAAQPLSFELYGEDILSGKAADLPDLSAGVDQALLVQELKLSCSNVMLQCLDASSRAIYILGTMFRLNSRMAADILGLTPQAYRQRLSRVRKKVGSFLQEYCGLSGTGVCSCEKRVNYAILTHRLNPAHLGFHQLCACPYQEIAAYTAAMEQLDELSEVFASFSAYRSSERVQAWVQNLLAAPQFAAVFGEQEAGI